MYTYIFIVKGLEITFLTAKIAKIDFVHSKWPKFGYVPKIGHIWLLSKN